MPKAHSTPSTKTSTKVTAGAPGKAKGAAHKPGATKVGAGKPGKPGETNVAARKPARAKAGSAAKKQASEPKPARPARVEVEVDRALKDRWNKASAALSALKQKGAAAFDDLWETVSEIVEHDPPLFLAGGFSTAKAFLTAHFEETERTAYRNMRVAKYASPAEEARYGVAKIDLVITYVEAKLGAPAKGKLPIDFARIKLPVVRDGREQKLGLEEVTAQEIAAATRELTRATKKAPSKASPVVTALTKAFSKGPLRAVTVRLSNGKLSFGGVDPGAIREFSTALAGVKLPEG